MQNYKEKTLEAYNKNAKAFSEKFKALLDLNRRYEFGRFLELLKGKKILDLGCGSGDHSLFFKDKGLDVISIDLSEEMIKICKQKGLNAKIMDIEDLKFENNYFDGIWSVTSLLHIPKNKLSDIITKLNNILKKDGILYICVIQGKNEGFIKDEFDSERFFSLYEKEELLNKFDEDFNLIEFKEDKLGNKIFLEFFFGKK